MKMFCADGAVPRKLKNIITSNYKMSMSTDSENYCAYNKTAHIETSNNFAVDIGFSLC